MKNGNTVWVSLKNEKEIGITGFAADLIAYGTATNDAITDVDAGAA